MAPQPNGEKIEEFSKLPMEARVFHARNTDFIAVTEQELNFISSKAAGLEIDVAIACLSVGFTSLAALDSALPQGAQVRWWSICYATFITGTVFLLLGILNLIKLQKAKSQIKKRSHKTSD